MRRIHRNHDYPFPTGHEFARIDHCLHDPDILSSAALPIARLQQSFIRKKSSALQPKADARRIDRYKDWPTPTRFA